MAFGRVWYAKFFQKLTSSGISGHVFVIISSFFSNSWLRVVLNRKILQEYPVNTIVPHGSVFVPFLFLLYITNLPDDIACNIAIYADDILSILSSVIRHLLCGNN